MRVNLQKVLLLSLLTIVSLSVIIFILRQGREDSWNFYYHLSIELIGGVVTIILFDVIIGNRQKRIESRNLLLRDLYSEEEEIRVMALDELLKERLLNGVILKRVDFTTLSLIDRSFEGISFFRCQFFGTQLNHATFKKCKFTKSNFAGANLNESTFSKCMLDDCDYQNSFFEKSNIIDSTFAKCKFDNAKFLKTSMHSSSFDGCSSKGAKVEDINIDDSTRRHFLL